MNETYAEMYEKRGRGDEPSQHPQFTRTPSVNARYKGALRRILARYRSVEDYIKIRYMHWQPVLEGTGTGVYHARATTGSKRSAIAHNDYPYHLKKGFAHFILWSVVPLSPATIERRIRDHFRIPREKYIWFINTPHKKSVPTLWHCHIIVQLTAR
jgi:hypothetical protein